MIIKLNLDGTINLIGKNLKAKNLTYLQAQNILIKLNFDNDCLFETLYAFEENGWNDAWLGICGGFLFGSYEGAIQ